MSFRLGVLATSVILSLLSPSAGAASYSSASLGPITITLYDLNPSDGILPSIFWNNNIYSTNNYVSTNAYDHALQVYQSNSNFGTLIGTNNSVTANSINSSATATVVGGADPQSIVGVTLNVSGHSLGGDSQHEASAFSPYYNNTPFTLSAYTTVVFSAFASVSVETTVGGDYTGQEYATAYAGLSVIGGQLGGTGLNGSGIQSSSSNYTAFASSTSSYVWNDATQSYDYIISGQNKSSSGVVGVAFTNLTNNTMNGDFIATASANGNSSVALAVTNVPEADSYALMLVGLGLIGSVIRRNQVN
jgi:hypothetical protein